MPLPRWGCRARDAGLILLSVLLLLGRDVVPDGPMARPTDADLLDQGGMRRMVPRRRGGGRGGDGEDGPLTYARGSAIKGYMATRRRRTTGHHLWTWGRQDDAWAAQMARKDTGKERKECDIDYDNLDLQEEER